MTRREFIALLGGAAAAWPLVARAQKSNSTRRVGVLMSTASDDPFGQANSAAFAQGLQQLGWEIGSNIRIDYRWGAGDTERFRKYAAELVGLSPDVILGTAASIVRALQEASRTIPIVFVTTVDPVGSGLVASLAHPGGNATGFTTTEFSQSAKLLELLKQIAPNVTRVAVLRDPFVPAGSGGFAAIQTAAPGFGVEPTPIGVHAAYRSTNALMSYGADAIEQYRRAASYVDRILKGERPADLPVQAPTKFKLVINLKTAKSLGLTIPPALITAADEMIE